jgi:hypothetical protein
LKEITIFQTFSKNILPYTLFEFYTQRQLSFLPKYSFYKSFITTLNFFTFQLIISSKNPSSKYTLRIYKIDQNISIDSYLHQQHLRFYRQQQAKSCFYKTFPNLNSSLSYISTKLPNATLLYLTSSQINDLYFNYKEIKSFIFESAQKEFENTLSEEILELLEKAQLYLLELLKKELAELELKIEISKLTE